jgi:hypothetical protein
MIYGEILIGRLVFLTRKQNAQATPREVREPKRGKAWVQEYSKKNGLDSIENLLEKYGEKGLADAITKLLLAYEAIEGDQRYDASLKSWVSQDPDHIIPYFVAEAVCILHCPPCGEPT